MCVIVCVSNYSMDIFHPVIPGGSTAFTADLRRLAEPKSMMFAPNWELYGIHMGYIMIYIYMYIYIYIYHIYINNIYIYHDIYIYISLG